MWNSIKNHPNDIRYKHTLREITQQPTVWQKVAKLVLEDSALKDFFSHAITDRNRPILVSGAGSSEFIGRSVLDTFGTLIDRKILNAPTTDIVTHPKKFLTSNMPSLMISFARSGNSPESLASVSLIKSVSPLTQHLIITCNEAGRLANITDENTYILLLPPETNDQSLVMTSSFSSMMLSVILCAYLSSGLQPYSLVDQMCDFVNPVFGDFAESLSLLVQSSNVDRVQYLGSSDALGLMTEAHLKMLEMTDGQVTTRVDSFLGLRHGPQVFINNETLVVAALSRDPYVRQYEIDMLKELKDKDQGHAYIVIGSDPSQVKLPNLLVYDTGQLDEFFRLFPILAIVQLLGLFKSLNLNLSPDAPSATGTINRVVQGVNIYPYQD